MPRNFFFVDLQQSAEGESFLSRVWATETSRRCDREAKKPWKGKLLAGRIEGELIYRTAISSSVVPFALRDPRLVALPVISEGGRLEVLTSSELLARGLRFGSKWFRAAELLWEQHRTEKSRNGGISLTDWLNYQSKLTDQNLSTPYLVLYTSSGSDACAAVLNRRSMDAPFIVEHKTYWAEFKSELEAHYVSAFINSGTANELIKAFQSRGLFGPRDIHKLIVQLPFPAFLAGNELHCKIAEHGKRAARIAEAVLAGVEEDIDSRRLGRLRSEIRQAAADELSEIDRTVAVLIDSRSVAAARSAGRGTKRGARRRTKDLFEG